jgi:hypothetical protein
MRSVSGYGRYLDPRHTPFRIVSSAQEKICRVAVVGSRQSSVLSRGRPAGHGLQLTMACICANLVTRRLGCLPNMPAWVITGSFRSGNGRFRWLFGVSRHRGLSWSGALWSDRSVETSLSLDNIQRCRGIRSPRQPRACAISQNRTRLRLRTAVSTATLPRSGVP